MSKTRVIKQVSRGCRKLRRAAAKHAPQLLAGASMATGIGTLYFAVKGTVASVREIDAYKKQNNIDRVPVKDAVKMCAHNYIPAFGTGAMTVGLRVGELVVGNNQKKAFQKAYQIAEAGRLASEASLLELKEATKTVVGEEAVKQIEEKVTEDHKKQLPDKQKEVAATNIWTRPDGKYRVYIPLIDSSKEAVPYNRYASVNSLEQAAVKLQKDLYGGKDQFVSLGDFMDCLHWEYPDVADTLLWDDTDNIEVRIGSTVTDDGELLLTLAFDEDPQQLLPM